MWRCREVENAVISETQTPLHDVSFQYFGTVVYSFRISPSSESPDSWDPWSGLPRKAQAHECLLEFARESYSLHSAGQRVYVSEK